MIQQATLILSLFSAHGHYSPGFACCNGCCFYDYTPGQTMSAIPVGIWRSHPTAILFQPQPLNGKMDRITCCSRNASDSFADFPISCGPPSRSINYFRVLLGESCGEGLTLSWFLSIIPLGGRPDCPWRRVGAGIVDVSARPA